jgi:hypothetical protein
MEAAEKGVWDLANKLKLFVFINRSENSPISNVDNCILFYLLFISCFSPFNARGLLANSYRICDFSI